MRNLVLLAALAIPASTSLAEPARERPLPMGGLPAATLDCQTATVQHARPGEPARPRRLDEMPPGKLIHAVERQVAGCRELVLVSEERSRLGR